MLILYLSMIDSDDRQSFEQIYDNNKDIMYHYAYRILNESLSAEDAVHDAFLSFARNFETLKKMDRDQTRSYLMISTRNASFKIYNKRKREISTEDVDSDGFVSDIAYDTENREIHKILFDMVKALDSKYSDVIMLKYYCNLRNKEIADTLNISNENVKIRLYRAKALLKSKLKEVGCIE